MLFELVTVGTWNHSFIGRHSQDNRDNTQTFLNVDFCELVLNPYKYDKKQIRVKAVLLQSHAVSVDGGEPYFYFPNCLGDNKAIHIEDHKNHHKTDPEVVKSLQKLQEKRDKYGNSRVWVTATGLFEKAGKSGFGHLSWANFRLLVMQFEKVEKFSGK